MRTLLKFIFEYLLQTYRKVAEKGAHGQEPMNFFFFFFFFKLGSLMQEHRLRENEFIHDLIKVKKIREDLESHKNVISLFSLKR
jgi:hypothetical protein